MTRAATLPTLLRRARAAEAKAAAALDAQLAADCAVIGTATRQAKAALARRGIEPLRCVVTFTDTTRARWWPGPGRLDRIEVYPAKGMDGAFVWRACVHLRGFNKRGQPLKTSSAQRFDLKHPTDLARELKLVTAVQP